MSFDILHMYILENIIYYLDYDSIYNLKLVNKNIYFTIKYLHNEKLHLFLDKIQNTLPYNEFSIRYKKNISTYISNDTTLYKKNIPHIFTMIIKKIIDQDDKEYFILVLKADYSLFNENFFIPLILNKADCIGYVQKNIKKSYIQGDILSPSTPSGIANCSVF